MGCSNEACIRLGLVVSPIVYSGRERSSTSGPIEIRNEIEVFIEGWLRLFVDDSEYLIDGALPCV